MTARHTVNRLTAPASASKNVKSSANGPTSNSTRSSHGPSKKDDGRPEECGGTDQRHRLREHLAPAWEVGELGSASAERWDAG